MDPQLEQRIVAASESNFYHTVTTIIITLSYGVYIPIFARSFRILCPKFRSSRISRILLPILVALFLTNTLFFSSTVSAILMQESWSRTTSSNLSLDQRLDISGSSKVVPARIGYIAQWLTYFLGDTIVVWRAYMICSSSLWRRLSLVSSLLGMVAVFFFNVSRLDFNYNKISLSRLLVSESIFSFVSFGVNLVATAFIVYETSFFHKLLGDAGIRKSPARTILSILTETGVIFCGIQLLTAVLNLVVVLTEPELLSFACVASTIVTNFSPNYAAMYPSLVIILIDTQRSALEASVVDIGNGVTDIEKNVQHSDSSNNLSAIRFASRTTVKSSKVKWQDDTHPER